MVFRQFAMALSIAISLLPASPAFPQEPPEAGGATSPSANLVEVTVTGQGASPQDALDDAVRSALRQVVGAFVRSDSKVVDDKLVQDRIISHSQGFIERVTKKGPARLKDGQYQQEAVVLVRRGKVGEVLAEPASSSSSVDGSSLAAKVRMLKEQKASASELMKVVFEDFPTCVLDCEVAPECALDRLKPSTPPKDFKVTIANDDVFLLVKVDIWVNERKWKAWADAAEQAFKAVSLAEFSSKLTPRKCGAQRVAPTGRAGAYWRDNWAAWMSEACKKSEHLGWENDSDGSAAWWSKLAAECGTMTRVRQKADTKTLNAPQEHLDADVVLVMKSDQARDLKGFVVPDGLIQFQGGAPSIEIELAGDDDAVFGTLVPHGRTESRAGSLLASLSLGTEFGATPCMFGELPQGKGNGNDQFIFLLPRLSSDNTTSSRDDYFSNAVLAGRCTYGVGFIVSAADLDQIRTIRVQLGTP
jgi:hypothetical protein